jgi:hypothetical protein
VDWGAVASFLDSGGKSGAADSDGLITGGAAGGTPSGPEADAAAEQRAARFEAAKDKSEEYSPMDTDNAQFVSMMQSATQAPGRGSANVAAGPLQAVLADGAQSNMLTGVDVRTACVYGMWRVSSSTSC